MQILTIKYIQDKKTKFQ